VSAQPLAAEAASLIEKETLLIRRAGHRARLLRIIAHPGIWSARWPTLLNNIHEIDIIFHEVSYEHLTPLMPDT
jgi:hypothetical protein